MRGRCCLWDKTKDVDRLKEFLGDQKAMISWKLDGLTIVLTYRNGELEKAVTRGKRRSRGGYYRKCPDVQKPAPQESLIPESWCSAERP